MCNHVAAHSHNNIYVKHTHAHTEQERDNHMFLSSKMLEYYYYQNGKLR